MKKIIPIVFIPFFVLADCHDDCVSFKQSMQSNLDTLVSDSSYISWATTSIVYWVSRADGRAANIQSQGDSTGDAYYIRQALSTATYNLNALESRNQQLLSLLSSSQSLLDSLDCGSSSSDCCPDLSRIESLLSSIQLDVDSISSMMAHEFLSTLNSFTSYFTEFNLDFQTMISRLTDGNRSLVSIDSNLRSLADQYTGLIPHDIVPLLTQIRDGITNQVSTVNVSLTNDFNIVVTNLTDISGILTRLDLANANLSFIQNSIDSLSSYLESITNELNYTNFLLDHGFFNITNNLDYLKQRLVGNSTTWPQITAGRYIMRYSNPQLGNQPSRYSLGTLSTQNLNNGGYLYGLLNMQYQLEWDIASLNNYFYDFTWRIFPTTANTLTNQLLSIHRAQTNYFSFFRGELGVQGVLADWHSQQVSGSYHDFLTNHYISVVRGGPLSGNQSTKTNWFSRIETLLAALVFTDSTTTNTVDTTAGTSERQQLATSYDTANQVAATFSDDFKATSQSIVDLYRSYFNTFESAAMPSHVVLMKLSSDDSEDIEIAFQSDSLGILVESCRVVTTLCWSSVGIFLLYKFLVWSARCVIVACQFVYRAISSVFKS